MKRFPFKLLFALVVIGLLVACRGDEPAEVPPTSPPPTETPTPAAERGDVPLEDAADESPTDEPAGATETAGGQGVIYAASFAAQPDGFSFRNYGPDYPQGDMTVNEVRELFGDGVCSRIDEDTDNCIPLAETQQWIDDRNADMKAGHCIGFTVTSYRFAEGDLQPGDFSPTANTPYELERRIPIMREIALNGSLYWVKSVWSSEVAGAPRDIIDGLIALGEPVDLSIFLPGLVGGHSLLAYGVEETAPDQYRILVYDNNFPGRELFVEVDYAANTWRYAQGAVNPDETAVPYVGDATTQTLRYIPLSAYESAACPFCPAGADAAPDAADAEPITLISVLGKGELLVKTALGNIGMVAGEIINELPGAFLILPRGQLAADGAPGVALPPGTDYTVEFNRLERVSSLGPGVSVVVDNLSPASDEDNTLTVATDGQSVEFQAGGEQAPAMTVTIKQGDATYNATLLGVTFAEGQGMSMGAAKSGQGLELRSREIDVADATLLITRLTGDAEAVFASSALNIKGDGGVTLDTAAWDGSGNIDLYEDPDGDGEYDETPVDLPNEPLDELLKGTDVAGMQAIIATLSPFLGSGGVEALLASLAEQEITGAEIGRLLRPFKLTDEQLIAIIPPLELPVPEVGELLFELHLEEERIEVVSEGLDLEPEDEAELFATLSDLALFNEIMAEWAFLKTDDLAQLVALLAERDLTAGQLVRLLPRLGLDEDEIAQVLRDLALSMADLEEIAGQMGIDLPATSTPTPTSGLTGTLTATATPTVTGTISVTPTATRTPTPTATALGTPVGTPTLSPYPGPLPTATGGPGNYPYPGPLPTATGGPGGYPGSPTPTPDYVSSAFCEGDDLRIIAEEPTWGANDVIELWAGDTLLQTGAIGPEGQPLVVTLAGPGTWADLRLRALKDPARVPLGTYTCPRE